MKILISEDQFEKIKKELEKPKKDKTARFIKCDSCHKFFTQTIHKGKKSLPICPWCGRHNTHVDENQEVDERSRSFAFTRKKRLFSKAELMANPARYRKWERDLKEIGTYKFSDNPTGKSAQLEDYEELMKEHPVLKKAGGFVYLYDIYEEETTPNVKIYVLDPKNKLHIGTADFELRGAEDFFVTLPFVLKEYRGKGIGIEIYKGILMFGNLVSGRAQSHQAVGLWKKLYRELPNKMVFVDDDGKEHEITTKNEKIVIANTGEDVYAVDGGYLKLYKN